MPKKASVLKRIRQSNERRERNKDVKSNMRTAIKKLNAAMDSRDIEQARQELQKVIPTIDTAASKGVIHKNTASRKISRLNRRFHVLSSDQSN